MPLRNKQRVFVESYLTTWNATQAAREAGYSERSAYSIGQENLKKPAISAYIQARLSDVCMTADECLVLLAGLARNSESENIQLAALKQIGLHHGLFTENLNLGGKLDILTEYKDHLIAGIEKCYGEHFKQKDDP